MNSLDDLYAQLKSINKSVVVVGHARPDMDCIGSAIALAELLQSWGLEAYAMLPEPIPSYASDLVENTPLVAPSADFLKGRTLVAVDVAEKQLLGSFSEFDYDIAIDHHIGHKEFAQHSYVESCSCVAEIVCNLWQKHGGRPSRAAADCLYLGYIFDTGRWWWGGLSPASFRNGAWLMECGVDTNALTERMYGQVSLGHLKLLQHTLERMRVLADGKIVIGVLTQADFVEAQANRYDKEGIVDVLRNIKGVQIAVLLREERGVCKASARARSHRGRVDKLCEHFGGGGHAAAAGIAIGISGSLDELVDNFCEVALQHWERVERGEYDPQEDAQ